MKHARQLRRNGALFVLLVLCAGELGADEPRQKRAGAKREQREVARLLKDFRGAKTTELKRALVEKALARGRPFAEALQRQVEAEGQARLRTYRQLFLATIDEAQRIEPASIVQTSDKLQTHRSGLLMLREWAGQLGEKMPAPREAADGIGDQIDDEGEPTGQEQLRQREQSFIQQWLSAKGYGRITSIEAALIQQVNRFRAEEKLAPLEVDYKLCAAARDHSADMVKERFFSHKSELRHKLTYADRAVRFGTTAHSENIANCQSPGRVVPMWKASSGHERNMADPRVQRVGVGHVGRKYTMMFGIGPVEKDDEAAEGE